MRATRTLLIGAAVAALVATGCEWHFETLDGAGGPNGRTTNVVGNDNAAVVYNGRPHVFSYDATDGNLRHGYHNGFFWAFETLDGAGGPNGRIDSDVGEFSTAIVYNGRPHVFYFDRDNGNLRHAYYNGFFWAFETLDGAGGSNGRIDSDVGGWNAAVLYNGRPHVFYADGPNGTLRHAYWNGLFWAFEILDGNGGPNGRTNRNVGPYSALVLYGGRPHVFYYDVIDDDLRHGYWNGLFWAFEILDGAGGPNGRVDAGVGEYNAVLLYNGRPHVFYFDDTDNTLRHGYWNGLFWAFETLDGNGGPNGRINSFVGRFNAAVLYNGRPHVFYDDPGNGHLRHAYYAGSAWGFEALDGGGGPNGRTNAAVGVFNAALLYNGRPDVFYYDLDNGDLRHAYFG